MRWWLWVLLSAAAANAVAASDSLYSYDDGSGQGNDDEEDYGEALQPAVIPTRVVPSLKSPAPPPVAAFAGGADDAAPVERVVATPIADPIYLEDVGSGDDEDVQGGPTPSFKTPTGPRGPLASATPELSSVASDAPPKGGGSTPAIVTTRLANAPPVLRRRLQKLAVVVGKPFRRQVPEDTFADAEEGGTRKLRLSLRWPNGSVVGQQGGWVNFDSTTQELKLLPVDENDVGLWPFRLVATDRQGQSADESLEIILREFPGNRLVNHEFEMTFTFTNWAPNTIADWQWKAMDLLFRGYFGESSLDRVLVRGLDAGSRDFSIRWTNITLTQSACPRQTMDSILDSMTAGSGNGGRPSEPLARALAKAEIYVKAVSLRHLGGCLASQHGGTGSDGSDTNNLPQIRNPLHMLNVTAGELLRHRVPADTCYDSEDGATPSLTLQLLTVPGRREVGPRSWLQFDTGRQEFVGVPLDVDVGREQYQLVCSDRSGLSALSGLAVVVANRPFNERHRVDFRLKFGRNVSDPMSRIRLVEELVPSYFGDADSSNIIVRSVDHHTFVWVNKSLASASCEDPRIEHLRTMLISRTSADAPVRDGEPPRRMPPVALRRHFADYQLSEGQVVLSPSCFATEPPLVGKDDGENAGGGAGDLDFTFHGLIPSTEYLSAFVVPAVIIILMLILACALACLLHRRRQEGKLSLFYAEQLPPRVPVILQDELVDDPTVAGGPGAAASLNPYGGRTVQIRPPSSLASGTMPRAAGPPFYGEAEGLLMQDVGPQTTHSLQRPTPVYRRP